MQINHKMLYNIFMIVTYDQIVEELKQASKIDKPFFNNIYNKTLSNEEYEVIRVKGYPISRIVINNCE